MKKQFSDLPKWIFEMDEVSAGVYEVNGHDIDGHKVTGRGIDLDALLEQCRAEALGIRDRAMGPAQGA
jgi:hypothetical protein